MNTLKKILGISALLLLSSCASKPPKENVQAERQDDGKAIELEFTTKFYDAVDKWVAFGKKGDSAYGIVGFIYIDEEAGFTLNTELTLDTEVEDVVVKYRLGRNTADVAILPDKEIERLGLPKVPDWLEIYKANENKNSYLVQMGYFYNHVGASHNAIEPLLKAYNKEPHFKRLEFELAYAYNATKDFDKAIAVLNKAIENDSKNYLLYKELGFSFIHKDKLDEAEKAYLQGIELITEESQKVIAAEMAINMANSYFQTKNKPKFEKWAELTKKYAEEDSIFYYYINRFEENWDKD
ncbi:MAG: hypothetical protein FWH22_09145 [Fibromonadales bacterium]|nr:hypothetical protein [Fibromonadales bacterium]